MSSNGNGAVIVAADVARRYGEGETAVDALRKMISVQARMNPGIWAIASAMEVGIHNTTVALTIALSVLDSTEVAIPSAVYSVLMYVFATAFGYGITRRHRSRAA